jgi:hypothetical protein
MDEQASVGARLGVPMRQFAPSSAEGQAVP